MDTTQHARPMAEKTDDEIIILAQRGSSIAFDELVMRYQKRVYALAYQMTHDPEEADDLAQESFIRAYHAIGRFQVGMKFYTWMYRIVVNLGINYYKRNKRTTNFAPDEEARLPDKGSSNPAKDLEDAELGDKIRIALETLPEHQRTVFALRVFQDMSYKDIAETLEIEIGTVMSRLNRAREALKTALKDYMD